MRTNKKYKLGVIGLGHMGLAIAKGAVRKEYLQRFEVALFDPSKKAQEYGKREGFTCLENVQEITKECHIVLLAVTPKILNSVLAELKGCDIDVLLSIVTGASIAHIQEVLGNVPVIRAMPNTPLQINAGSTALCMSSNCKADDYDFVFQLFASMGVTRTISEDKMNDIVAVHGSTPAYVYYFVDCILKDAVQRGIDEEAARALLVQTVIGAGQLLAKNASKPLDEFIKEVATEGGTTIEAITTLKEEKMDEIIHDANENCIARAKQLGK